MLFLHAENALAAGFGKHLYTAYCTEFYFYSSTYKTEINAEETCWPLGITHPSKKWRLDWHFHTKLRQQDSDRNAWGKKPEVDGITQ